MLNFSDKNLKVRASNVPETPIKWGRYNRGGNQRLAGEAIFEIGRRLKHVKENDLAHGEWAKWCEKEIGMTTQYANRFIRVFDRFSNRNPGFSFAKVTLSTLNALVPFTDEQLEQEYELPDGTRKKPVDMSRREIEELKRRLRQAEQEAGRTSKQYNSGKGYLIVTNS